MVVRDYIGYWTAESAETWPIPEVSAWPYKKIKAVKFSYL
jgi:hypothetical protein